MEERRTHHTIHGSMTEASESRDHQQKNPDVMYHVLPNPARWLSRAARASQVRFMGCPGPLSFALKSDQMGGVGEHFQRISLAAWAVPIHKMFPITKNGSPEDPTRKSNLLRAKSDNDTWETPAPSSRLFFGVDSMTP